MVHPSSPVDYDENVDSDDDSVVDGDQARHVRHETTLSPDTTDSASTTQKAVAPIKPSSHLQKRRRVTRACDECRRKKIKCDGKQPCTHCTVYSYECTYDQPSNRRRNPAPQYVEGLELRVQRAETLLHILVPNLDLNDPNVDAAIAQGWVPGVSGKRDVGIGNDRGGPHGQTTQQTSARSNSVDNNNSDANIESMLRAVAQIDMDEGGNWGYHGHSSGLSFVRRMREQLGDLMGPEAALSPFIKTRALPELRHSSKLAAESPETPAPDNHVSTHHLPPKAVARETCAHAVEDAAVLLCIVHRPSFWSSFERLYSIPHEQYTDEDHKFLPLFFSAMALGSLFRSNEQTKNSADAYEIAIEEGINYFRTTRQLVDIADCRNLAAIQAVLFMILFMQSSAKMSQCYAYIGVALRSSLRMGLHRAHGNRFNPLESEMRKRIFWCMRKMDIYVGALLGLPLTLSDDDIDQEFPAEVDDEYLSRDALLPMPKDQVSMMTAFNSHTRLMQILYKIVRYIYPIKIESSKDKSYSVPFSAIRELEGNLEDWKKGLPSILNPCPAPERYTRAQQLLRLSYAHAQVMLYRPFLHFVAMDKRSKRIDPRSYACAASYVNVSRNIIHIQTQMKQKGLLDGAFWFTQYTSFFAILSLVYFAAENPDNATTEAVMKDAIEGKEVLAALAKRSMAADRCTATLDVIFQRLPDWMRNGQQNPISTKKRQIDSLQGSRQQQRLSARSSTDVSPLLRQDISQIAHRRASTFPVRAPTMQTVGNLSNGNDIWAHSGATAIGSCAPAAAAAADRNGFNLGGLTQPNLPQPQPYMVNAEGYTNPALADISGMFPAADEPFGYPTQPLTTFENQKHYTDDLFVSAQCLQPQLSFGVDMDASGQMITGDARGAGDDGMEAQFFALPPYIDRQQHIATDARPTGLATYLPTAAPQFGGGHGTSMDPLQDGTSWMHQAGQTPPIMAQGAPNGDASANQINIQDLFGGNEWSPMLMTGYQMQ